MRSMLLCRCGHVYEYVVTAASRHTVLTLTHSPPIHTCTHAHTHTQGVIRKNGYSFAGDIRLMAKPADVKFKCFEKRL